MINPTFVLLKDKQRLTETQEGLELIFAKGFTMLEKMFHCF